MSTDPMTPADATPGPSPAALRHLADHLDIRLGEHGAAEVLRACAERFAQLEVLEQMFGPYRLTGKWFLLSAEIETEAPLPGPRVTRRGPIIQMKWRGYVGSTIEISAGATPEEISVFYRGVGLDEGITPTPQPPPPPGE